MHTPTRSPGRLGASCGASNPALARPQNDDIRVLNQALEGVPVLTPADHNAARRLITLIDVWYDQVRE